VDAACLVPEAAGRPNAFVEALNAERLAFRDADVAVGIRIEGLPAAGALARVGGSLVLNGSRSARFAESDSDGHRTVAGGSPGERAMELVVAPAGAKG